MIYCTKQKQKKYARLFEQKLKISQSPLQLSAEERDTLKFVTGVHRGEMFAMNSSASNKNTRSKHYEQHFYYFVPHKRYKWHVAALTQNPEMKQKRLKINPDEEEVPEVQYKLYKVSFPRRRKYESA